MEKQQHRRFTEEDLFDMKRMLESPPQNHREPSKIRLIILIFTTDGGVSLIKRPILLSGTKLSSVFSILVFKFSAQDSIKFERETPFPLVFDSPDAPWFAFGGVRFWSSNSLPKTLFFKSTICLICAISSTICLLCSLARNRKFPSKMLY